jgi:hypothetical protein
MEKTGDGITVTKRRKTETTEVDNLSAYGERDITGAF